MKKVKVGLLVEDFDIYPRTQVDGTHVTNLVASLEAGEKLPCVVVDEESLRIIDGFHRTRAYRRLYGDDHELAVETRKYASVQDMFLDGVRMNARHGKGITGSERTAAILKAENLKITRDCVASALGITRERAENIVRIKSVLMRPGRNGHARRIALKNSVRHLAQSEAAITKEQAAVIESAPGQPQVLLLRQLNDLIECGLMDMEDERIVEQLRRLEGNLESLLEKVTA